ncbi:MAG: LysR family transcriptional regulator [Solobacterium sp.]|nr:LysR family transcriptional regulator [Solobacterium sp.]
MDVRSQTYMIALAEQGSLQNAARELGISQPALSAWLNNLEQELDVQLVIRNRSGIILTPAGRLYLEGSRKMIAERDRFYREVKLLASSDEEIIRIGGTPSGGTRVFARFYKHFRNVMPSATLQFVECYNRDMLELVRKGKIDFGIGSISDPDFPDIECCTGRPNELILLIPEGFAGYYDPSGLVKDAQFPAVDFDLIQNQPFIMPSEQVSFCEALHHLFEQAGYKPNIVFRSSNTGAIGAMIKAGNGIGVVSRRNFSPLEHIAPYSFDPPFIVYPILAYRKDRVLSKADKELIRFQNEQLISLRG